MHVLTKPCVMHSIILDNDQLHVILHTASKLFKKGVKTRDFFIQGVTYFLSDHYSHTLKFLIS